ncbi:hypothetical protein [Aquamicrobium sp. LC103]|uniref:hypothetical protein n=1 Tax=Aquamicrobium sp. LC103 TaxID=1120658 RepID=UPI00063ED02F|nr:hypothetical protein [Aquamicrobium sp. LC103]TKT81025.1 hypothetical protein XW59_003870 [Aquamicrobium sp. LC103]
MISVAQYLTEHGPSRSSRIVEAFVTAGLTPEAARQRVSRANEPVRRFPVPLLPKREAFLYLAKDRNRDNFWLNFIRDMRESGSIYAAAIDGLIARGGLIQAAQFPTISGAPVNPTKGQLHVDTIAKRLRAADFMKEVWDADEGACYQLAYSLAEGSFATMRARDLTERILLDGLREWCRRIGFASYNSIRIRGDAELKAIGPFPFDLAGPSYLLPLQGGPAKPGFVVADVFAEGMLTANQIQYFIRKSRVLKSTFGDIRVLSILVAEAFTGEALTAGHAAGIVMATPKDLFGKRVGAAVSSLCEVLKNAAKYSSSSPERLTLLLDSLFDIEGRNGNLRGVLFELVAGYLARRDAASIDMNIKATDPSSGKTAEIDVQKITHQTKSVTAIECKGKEPGGVLSLEEVETWLKKISIVKAHYREHNSLREAQHRFEIWTSGSIAPEALAKLAEEKEKRIKSPIDWKDGRAVLDLAKLEKEKGIVDALNQHFLVHPLAAVAKKLEADKAVGPIPAASVPQAPPAQNLPAPAYDFVSLDSELDRPN